MLPLQTCWPGYIVEMSELAGVRIFWGVVLLIYRCAFDSEE